MECTKCGTTFPSRNTLFKHLRICLVLAPQSADSLQSEAVEDFLRSNEDGDVYLYATGGRVRGRTLGSVERYSFRRGCWEMCSYLIDNRGSHGCASINGTLFVIGGGGFKTNLASCEKLSVTRATDCAWTSVAPLATFRHALAVVAVDGAVDRSTPSTQSRTIYAIGGWVDGSVCSSDVERYDSQQESWVLCAPLLVARRLLGACSYNGSIFVFGGHDATYDTPKAERYDILNNSWALIKDVPVAGPASCATVGKFVFVFVNGSNVFRYDPDTDDYLDLGPLPMAEWFCYDACTRGQCVYLVGGKVGGVFSKAAWKYNTSTNSWEAMPDMLRQRRRTAVDIVSC